MAVRGREVCRRDRARLGAVARLPSAVDDRAGRGRVESGCRTRRRCRCPRAAAPAPAEGARHGPEPARSGPRTTASSTSSGPARLECGGQRRTRRCSASISCASARSAAGELRQIGELLLLVPARSSRAPASSSRTARRLRCPRIDHGRLRRARVRATLWSSSAPRSLAPSRLQPPARCADPGHRCRSGTRPGRGRPGQTEHEEDVERRRLIGLVDVDQTARQRPLGNRVLPLQERQPVRLEA